MLPLDLRQPGVEEDGVLAPAGESEVAAGLVVEDAAGSDGRPEVADQQAAADRRGQRGLRRARSFKAQQPTRRSGAEGVRRCGRLPITSRSHPDHRAIT